MDDQARDVIDDHTDLPHVRGEVVRLARELHVRDREEQAARRENDRLRTRAEELTGLLARHAESLREAERAAVEAQSARADAERDRDEAACQQRNVERALAAAERARSEHEQAIVAIRRRCEQAERDLGAEQELRLDAERRCAEAEEHVRASAGEHAELCTAIEAERDTNAGLSRELEELQLELSAARRQAQSTEQMRQRSITEYAAQLRQLQQMVSAQAVGIRQVEDDIRRAEASRAWRYGHRFTRLVSGLARRRTRTRGALVAALARIDQIQGATRALPAPGGSGGEAGDPRSPSSSPVAAGAASAKAIESTAAAAAPRAPAGPLLSPAERRETDDRRELLAAELRERLGPAPEREAWPRVSMIVLTRNGRHHLEHLLPGLVEHTDYPDFELVIVDNASSDDTRAYLETLDPPFPMRVLLNDQNLSFAEANARGAQRAEGELLLFLNNDVEPFERGWLKELVCALEVADVDAVGATLLHPEDLKADPQAPPIVQHRTIRFRWQDGMVKAFNSGDGDALWDAGFGIETRAAAVTAACMLIGREAFERVSGFGGGYRYGTEDVDLGLKLLVSGGESAGVGRAVLVHRESSTQNRESREFRRNNRLENRRLFQERWAPQMLREYRLARLRRESFWTDGGGSHIAITLTSLDARDGWGDWYSGHEIGDALEAQGWHITYVQRKGDQWYELPQDLDYVLSLMDPFDLSRVPEHVVTIAWIRNWTERWLERPWFERADILLASSHGTAELIERTTGRRTIRFPLAVNPARFRPRPVREELASDYVFTGNWWGKDRDIQQALAPRPDERIAVYGKDWDQVPELAPHARGELPYAELPEVYASAKLVLDDTQGPTLPYGAVNARVFDALAAGTLPITNCESGVRELFDEEFPVWSSRETLRASLDELLGDADRRRALTRRYREIVLGRHTYAHRAAELRRLLVEHEQRLTFALKIGAPNREAAQQWGDLHFARSLAAELRRRGHRSCIQTLDEWELESGLVYDVVIHLKGLSRYHPKPGQFNVLWSISHPDGLTGEECDGYDLVCVASDAYAETLGARTMTPVVVLEQAADPWVMHPDPRPDLAHDLVYVANSRNVLRPVARDLLSTEHDLAIWGANWDGLIDTRRVLGTHVPNDELRHVYSSAGIVLNDHWQDMREHGYISNRIYDALACGAFVISDHVPGLTERFGEAVASFDSAEELRALVDRFVAEPEERRRRGQLGRELVLAGHTFAHRVEQLLELLEQRMGGPGHPRRLRPGAGVQQPATVAEPVVGAV